MSTTEQRKQRQAPVYIQIKEALIRDIQMYNKAGDMLASEFELSSIYNVNRHTLRRAVDELIKEGVVERHHGKGTIVRAPSIHYPIASRTRLTETLEAQGISTSSRVIRKQQVSARGGVAKALAVDEGTPLIFLEILRETKSKPFCVASHFLPHRELPKILSDFHKGSLHSFIEMHYQQQLHRAESRITSVMPQPEDVIALKIPKNLSVLRVKSINTSQSTGRPMEYVITRFRSDMTQIVVQPDSL